MISGRTVACLTIFVTNYAGKALTECAYTRSSKGQYLFIICVCGGGVVLPYLDGVVCSWNIEPAYPTHIEDKLKKVNSHIQFDMKSNNLYFN